MVTEVQGGLLAQAAVWGGVLNTVFAVMQFQFSPILVQFSPILGSLWDAVGRRPALLVSLFVMALDYLIMAVGGNMWLLLLGRSLGGITAATHSTAGAYTADVSPPEKKAADFGLPGAAFGAGFVLGPLMGGLLGELGTRAPIYAAALLVLANFTLGWFVMGETVRDENRLPFVRRRADPFGAFRAAGRIPGIKALLRVYFLNSVAIYVYPAIWSYFTLERFGWKLQVISLSLAVYGVSMALVQGWLLRYTVIWAGERQTVIWGQVFDFIAFGIPAFISNSTLAMLLIPVSALGAVVQPAVQGMMAQAVEDNQQGELQGVLTAVNALAILLMAIGCAVVLRCKPSVT